MTKKYLDYLGLVHLWTLLKIKFANKVDKEDGKGLSTNDYTTTEKNKLAGIASGAEVNVNADWNAITGDALILNKPTIPSKTSDLTNDSGFITTSDIPEGAAASNTTPKMDGTAAVGSETAFARGDHRHPSDTSKQDVIDASHKLSADLVEDGTANKAYTAAEKDKLGGIAAGAEVNVQADWTETSTSSDAYIKNKPTLAAVATSGSYDDLSNKPTIPDDSNLVHKTGNESISGIKSFQQIKRINPVDVLNEAWNWITYKDLDDGYHTLQDDLDARNNVQADWNQTTTTAADYIKNKPSIPSASATTPKMNGEAAVGSETKWAKGDHVHPTDTSRAADNAVVHLAGNETITGDKTIRAAKKLIVEDSWNQIYNFDDDIGLGTALNQKANLASPALTGTPTAPTATAGTNTTQIATTAFVKTAVNGVTASSLGVIPTTQKGAANGVCPLNASSKIDSTYLPSYVDDVIEAYARAGLTALSSTWLATGSASGTVITPESGKIYLLMSDSGDYSANTQFRYSGTTYVKLNDGGITKIENSEIDDIIEN